MNIRNGTPSVYIGYALYFYFFGLSLDEHLKDYHLVLSNETIFLLRKNGTGYKSKNLKGYPQKERILTSLLSMKP